MTRITHSWAVKEAAYKALFPHERLTWKQLTVAYDEGMIDFDIYIYLETSISFVQGNRISLSTPYVPRRCSCRVDLCNRTCPFPTIKTI